MTPQATALLIIDDSNDFLAPDGAFHGAVKGQLENGVLAAINSAVVTARSAGCAVIRIPLSFSEDYREMGNAPFGVFAAIKEAGAFRRGSHGAALSTAIASGPDDIVLEGKNTLDAFASTDLAAVLAERRIGTIAVAGLLTNLCVSSTMRTAYDRRLEVIGLTDACAALDLEHHVTTTTNDWPLHAHPMTSKEFKRRLCEGKDVAHN